MTETTLQVEEQKQEVPATTEQQAVKKNYIQVWYHDNDHELIRALDAYLQLMYRRLGPQIGGNYFNYRGARNVPKAPEPYTGMSDYFLKEYEKQKQEYEEGEQKYQRRHRFAISTLGRTMLLIVCVSNDFIEAFWEDLEQNQELAEFMAHPDFQLLPLVIRPTETGMMYQFQPLCSYQEGYQRETACKEIASMVETIIRNNYGPDLQVRKTPVSLLFQSAATIQISIPSEQSSADLLRETFAPIKVLLEQASTQIVEAKQLAISERSQREGSEADLRCQVERMQEQLVTLQTTQDTTLLARLRRLFISSSK